MCSSWSELLFSGIKSNSAIHRCPKDLAGTFSQEQFYRNQCGKNRCQLPWQYLQISVPRQADSKLKAEWHLERASLQRVHSKTRFFLPLPIRYQRKAWQKQEYLYFKRKRKTRLLSWIESRSKNIYRPKISRKQSNRTFTSTWRLSRQLSTHKSQIRTWTHLTKVKVCWLNSKVAMNKTTQN